MDLMFANMVSSGLCVPIHQPQTHLCNLGGNLSEERWAAESPPHCLAGPDEISKHTAVQTSARVLLQQTREGERHANKLQDQFVLECCETNGLVKVNLSNVLKF